MDAVIIKGLKVYGYHGCKEEEKINGQDFIFDVELLMNYNKATDTDSLEDTVNYSTVCKEIIAYQKDVKRDTIEMVAGDISRMVLENHPMVDKVVVSVSKPQAPVKADFETMIARIERSRN